MPRRNDLRKRFGQGLTPRHKKVAPRRPQMIIAGGGGGGVSAANVVIGPTVSVDNAIVRFDGTTGKLIQDYTSAAPTVGDTGLVTITGGLTVSTGAVSISATTAHTNTITNTSSYSVGTNQVNFLSTVANGAGTYAFDFKDTIAAARTATSYMFGLRDSAGTYKFRILSSGTPKLIIGGITLASTMTQATWSMNDNATGTSADPGLKVTGSVTGDSIFTAGTVNGLLFKAGSNPGGSASNGLRFQEDGSGATANDNYTSFVKLNVWANVTANDWMQWDWATNAGFPTDARRVFKCLVDSVNDVYISQGGRWGNQAARVGYAQDTVQFQTWDLILGGGFKFTGVGAAEPVT